jgi:hypothetical protein
MSTERGVPRAQTKPPEAVMLVQSPLHRVEAIMN